MLPIDRPDVQSKQLATQGRKHILLDALEDVGKFIDNNPSLYGRLAKHYKWKHLEIHVHLTTFFSRKRSISNDCLVFRWPTREDIEALNLNTIAWRKSDISFTESSDSERPMPVYQMKCPMLIDVCQLIQCPKRLNSVVWPTIVRLQPVDD